MIIGVAKETKTKENRVALTPDVIKDIIKKGFKVQIESGAGQKSFYPDQAYQAAGASITSSDEIYRQSDVVLKVNPPSAEEIAKMKKGAVLISFMWAVSNPAFVETCANAGITAFSMDAIPRISRAQKMDALSSQANLGGYKAVLLAADTIGKILPMMTTAAGTIRPCKVLIFGAGVAGLQR